MGRTKRKRKRTIKSALTSEDKDLIDLQKWLALNKWENNTKLKIKSFLETGRGVTSKKSISPKQILISIPTTLMISYKTIKIDFPIKEKFTIHEILALFLMIEKEKKVNSKWYKYIKSLPKETPSLPWLASEKELKLFPQDLRLFSEKSCALFKIFYEKVKRFMVLPEEQLCQWAYIMVNTRAVYVDPSLMSDNLSNTLLIDEPSMALCPFLDMFNHNYTANTEASLVDQNGVLLYQLRTLTGFRKNRQIFISYGQHDNKKLLMEYGFFIPGNIYDTISFEFQEVLKALGTHVDQNRYKFIKDHNFYSNLYIGYEGVSYNLKVLLYTISYCDNIKILGSIVFSNNYPTEFIQHYLPKFIEILLNFKREIFKSDLLALGSSDIKSESTKLVLAYVKYRCNFVNELSKLHC